MPTMQLRNSRTAAEKSCSDNLHRIAISNINDSAYVLKRWWRKKYRQPPKPLDDYTYEELYIEYLEDFYLKNPDEIERFENALDLKREDGWDGKHNDEVERDVQRRLKKIKQADPAIIEKYRTYDEDMTKEEFDSMLESVGKNLPGSRTKKKVDTDEFNDVF